MGNRAIVKPINSNIGVYLHWHGGIDSVRAFLTYCKLRDFRDFGGEFSDGYGIARFCQVVGNYLGGSLSMGVYDNIEETLEQSKYYDNGIYVIDGWRDRFCVLCDYDRGGCGAESGWYHYEVEAVEAWNKRVKIIDKKKVKEDRSL